MKEELHDSQAKLEASKKTAEFLYKQYAHVRSELDEAVKETRTLERYAILITGGIWGWYFTRNPTTLIFLSLWLPFFINMLIFVRVWSLYKHILRTSQFILNTEEFFQISNRLGWEQFLIAHPSNIQAGSAWLIWGSLISMTFFAPWLVMWLG
jgi:hypothetical protein